MAALKEAAEKVATPVTDSTEKTSGEEVDAKQGDAEKDTKEGSNTSEKTEGQTVIQTVSRTSKRRMRTVRQTRKPQRRLKKKNNLAGEQEEAENQPLTALFFCLFSPHNNQESREVFFYRSQFPRGISAWRG